MAMLATTLKAFILMMMIQSTTSQSYDEPNSLNILHWVHVPKAGGTAITTMMKKVVCKINPHIQAISPCCKPKLCLHHDQCYAAVGGCPLVTAVGRHTTNMAMATSTGCCNTDLGMSITSSFIFFGLPKAADFVNDASTVKSLKQWPLTERVAFFLSTGVSRSNMMAHLTKKDYPPEIMGGRSISELIEDAMSKVTSTYESDISQRNKRLGDCSMLSRIKHYDDVGRADFVPEGCKAHSFAAISGATPSTPYQPPPVGHYSLTMLRHSFPRALSASMYKGHNPNYDVFDLRPGLWLHPSVKPRGYRNFNFYDYVSASEYQNSLVKMFGLSRDCAQGRSCDAAADKEDRAGKRGGQRRTSACTLANQCLAYRNASLDESHLVIAARILKRFRFVGLQEAYNSSVLLLAATFDLEVEENDFEKQRHTSNEELFLCKGYTRRAVGSDPDVCRAVMEANSLDVKLYEMMHREFCSRLEAKGLLTHPKVVSELSQRRMCADVDFSNPDDYCGQFETEEVQAFRRLDKQNCPNHIKDYKSFKGDFPKFLT